MLSLEVDVSSAFDTRQPKQHLNSYCSALFLRLSICIVLKVEDANEMPNQTVIERQINVALR